MTIEGLFNENFASKIFKRQCFGVKQSAKVRLVKEAKICIKSLSINALFRFIRHVKIKKNTLHDIDIYYFFVFLHGKPGFLTHVSCMTSLVSEAKH